MLGVTVLSLLMSIGPEGEDTIITYSSRKVTGTRVDAVEEGRVRSVL